MDDFKKKLNPEQYRIMREKGTETPFSGKYVDETAKGVYTCAACGNELFSSDTKFDAGSGWPSFTDPVNKKNVTFQEDKSYGMDRVEVLCKNCGSHLGHVFPGHAKKGKDYYCINSACLNLEKKEGEPLEVEVEVSEGDDKDEKKDGPKKGSGPFQNLAALAGMLIAGTAIGGAMMNYMQPIICSAPQATAPAASAPVSSGAPVAPAPAAGTGSAVTPATTTPAGSAGSADGTTP